jgi:23S rRNA pseudouridine1911/1915/1917 synthase
MNKVIIDENYSSERLDAFLTKILEGKTRSYCQKMIEEERVLVNSKIVTKASLKLKEGDVVEYDLLIDKPLEIVKKDIKLDVLYEDEDLLVINKPRGMVVHPSNGHYDGDTLVNALLYSVKDLSSINGVVRPGIVHRIDKDTSGLLVVAKNNEAHLFLSEQLKDHSMYREYMAITEGVISNTDLKIIAPIGKDPNNRLKRCVDVFNGKDAVTYVHVIERFKSHTLVSCKLETGRTHQIRVHMKHIGFPLVGDPVYGRRHQTIPCEGQMLHAYKITFKHPRTKEMMTFTCEPDAEFKRVLDIVREEK